MGLMTVPTKVRKDPLGFGLVGRLVYNLGLLQRVSNIVGHNHDGSHNCVEAPRCVGTISEAATVYSIVTGATSFISSVVRNGVGDVTVNFTASKVVLTGDQARVRIAIADANAEAKPHIWTVEAAGSNAVRVHLFELSSALGVGNTWAAADVGFCISVNAAPYIDVSTAPTALTWPIRGNALGVDTGNWNTFVQQLADAYATLKTGHTAAGVHNVREVARACATFLWDGTTYSRGIHSPAGYVEGLTRNASGDLTINLRSGSFTTTFQVFPVVDFKRSIGTPETGQTLYCLGCSSQTATTVRLWIYQYDFSAKTWARADANFALEIHTAAY